MKKNDTQWKKEKNNHWLFRKWTWNLQNIRPMSKWNIWEQSSDYAVFSAYVYQHQAIQIIIKKSYWKE